jgi:ATP-dependent Lhr-like helicase
MRNQQPTGELIAVSAADPLNLVGIVVPGERVAVNSGRMVAFRDGVAAEPGEHANVIRMPLAR